VLLAGMADARLIPVLRRLLALSLQGQYRQHRYQRLWLLLPPVCRPIFVIPTLSVLMPFLQPKAVVEAAVAARGMALHLPNTPLIEQSRAAALGV
jgi:hypothetical protein